jgi:DNA-binding XRE family transcriptional regulator
MDTFNSYLRELGWNRTELGKRLGLNKNTISRWKEPREYAMAYLRLAIDISRVLSK